MATDDNTHDDVGRDPLAPDDLAAPPQPTEPPRPERKEHQPGEGELREPLRLRETSVRRLEHRDEDGNVIASGLHDVSDPQSTMGATMAAERRRQGKSLADVEAATRIRGRLIESLEKGEYDALPSQAYVKGYIQSYADYLEIPSGPLVAQFNAETAGREAKAEQHPYITAPIPAAGAAPRRRGRSGGGGRSYDLHLPGGKWWLWVLALIVVVASAIGIAGLLSARSEKVAPLPNPVETPSKLTTGAVGQTTGTPVATATPKPPPKPVLPPNGYIIVVKAKPGRRTTVRIASQGTILWNKSLENGQSATVTPTADATVRLGVPDAALVSLNGTQVQVPANNGNPLVLTLARPAETTPTP
jgi:cytoskeletal protein RodZ